MKVDFATFCYKNDAHRLHQPGQLKKQVESNDYPFNKIFVVYQGFSPDNRPDKTFYDQDINGIPIHIIWLDDIDKALTDGGIDINKPQYQSPTDKHHSWKYHVANHVVAAKYSQEFGADYIVFADNDCWIVRQPNSWVEAGIKILRYDSLAFIVSPNDGEPSRTTFRMSQQMFLVKVDDFRNMDFNQPGWDGNVNIEGGPMPEYHGMLEGRMHYYCRYINRYRYVLPEEYRYFHHNRLTEDGMFDTDYEKLGWV